MALQKIVVHNPGRRRVTKPPTKKQLAARAKFTAMVRAKAASKQKAHRRRGNIAAGYYDMTGFHPIRSSWDYDPTRLEEPEGYSGRRRKGRKKYQAPTKKITKRSGRAVKAAKKAGSINRERKHRKRRKNSGVVYNKFGSNLRTIPVPVIYREENPKMARRRRKASARRSNTSYRRRRRSTARSHRRRSNPTVSVARRANPGRRRRYTKVVVRNRGRRHYRRHRNPGIGMGNFTGLAWMFGGAIATSTLNKMLPANLRAGVIGYASTAACAMVSSWGISKFFGRAAGNKAMTGGLIVVGLQVLSDFFPQIGQMLPFGLRGSVANLGFFSPQVPIPGSSFNQWATPLPITNAIAAIPHGGGMGGVMNSGIRTGIRV